MASFFWLPMRAITMAFLNKNYELQKSLKFPFIWPNNLKFVGHRKIFLRLKLFISLLLGLFLQGCRTTPSPSP